MDVKKKLKMAMIAGASHVLKYKKSNPGVSDEEALQQLNRDSTEIADRLDSQF